MRKHLQMIKYTGKSWYWDGHIVYILTVAMLKGWVGRLLWNVWPVAYHLLLLITNILIKKPTDSCVLRVWERDISQT